MGKNHHNILWSQQIGERFSGGTAALRSQHIMRDWPSAGADGCGGVDGVPFTGRDNPGRRGNRRAGAVRGLGRVLLVAATTLSLAACNDDAREASSSSISDATSAGGSSAPVSPTTTPSNTEPRASASFCSLAVKAAGGEFDFTSEARVRELTEDPGLSDDQRLRVAAAAADAVRQIELGGGYSNDLLVSAVNDICGRNLTPVTMVE